MADKEVLNLLILYEADEAQMLDEWSTNLALSTINLFSIFCCFFTYHILLDRVRFLVITR